MGTPGTRYCGHFTGRRSGGKVMTLRRRMENDIEADIREHVDAETRDNIERGMSPEEARLAALRKFGNPLRVAEETRAVWRWAWAERLLEDTRYALRGLRRNPVF